MTIVGWVQIALFSLIVIAVTRPLGGYMTSVFAGERTFLWPVLRPVERAVYWCCGVDEREEQHGQAVGDPILVVRLLDAADRIDGALDRTQHR